MHAKLASKIKKYLPISYLKLMRSCLRHRESQTKVNEILSNNFPVKSGYLLLYVLYTANLPTNNDTITGTFANDTAVIAVYEDTAIASTTLQTHINDIQAWLHRWRIKTNESKSIQVTFTLRKCQCPPVSLNNVQFPQSTSLKYLGIHLESRLNWREHNT